MANKLYELKSKKRKIWQDVQHQDTDIVQQAGQQLALHVVVAIVEVATIHTHPIHHTLLHTHRLEVVRVVEVAVEVAEA